MTQRTQIGYDGARLFRWHVVANDGQRFVTWATDSDAARSKAMRRTSVVSVVKVDPCNEVCPDHLLIADRRGQA